MSEVRITRSVSAGPSNFEITRVDCITKMQISIVYKYGIITRVNLSTPAICHRFEYLDIARLYRNYTDRDYCKKVLYTRSLVFTVTI